MGDGFVERDREQPIDGISVEAGVEGGRRRSAWACGGGGHVPALQGVVGGWQDRAAQAGAGTEPERGVGIATPGLETRPRSYVTATVVKGSTQGV